MSAGDKPATMAMRPTALEASGNLDAARRMARASVLLGEGNRLPLTLRETGCRAGVGRD
jgi:hypothetical protein